MGNTTAGNESKNSTLDDTKRVSEELCFKDPKEDEIGLTNTDKIPNDTNCNFEAEESGNSPPEEDDNQENEEEEPLENMDDSGESPVVELIDMEEESDNADNIAASANDEEEEDDCTILEIIDNKVENVKCPTIFKGKVEKVDNDELQEDLILDDEMEFLFDEDDEDLMG